MFLFVIWWKHFWQKIFKKLKKDPYLYLILASIFLIGAFFRLYDFFDRLVIVGDCSREAQIALYAAKNLQFPQIGPFAQAPFFFGPWWYWLLTLTYFLPLGLFAPWYLTTLFSFAFIFLMYFLGKEIGGRKLGLIVALFTAISSAAINNYFFIWNPTIIPVLTSIVLILFFKNLEKKSTILIFILGFVLGLSTVIHFQSALLLPIGLIAVVLLKKKIKNLLLLSIGIFIPFIPILIFDIRFNWFWTKSAFIYFIIDQPSVQFPYRWLTYVFQFWPDLWTSVIGYNKATSFALIFLVTIATLISLKNFRLYKKYFLLALIVGVQVILYRYYKGPRQIYYVYFFHVPILLLTAWASLRIFTWNKVLGWVIIISIVIFTSKTALETFTVNTITVKKVADFKNEIYNQVPSESYDIYGCKINSGALSHPLGLFMFYENKNDLSGTKIGVCEIAGNIWWKPLSREEVTSGDWLNRSTEFVFKDNLEWWKEKPPITGGNFWEFVKRKLSPKCWPHCD